tara:strand:+ start:452 stop:1426 length:975 start_codon:yes stop_codon:yes gene_type:complete
MKYYKKIDNDLLIPENIDSVLSHYHKDDLIGNLMPKCGTMYVRKVMTIADLWYKHTTTRYNKDKKHTCQKLMKIKDGRIEWSSRFTDIDRGRHYVFTNRYKGAIHSRGWNINLLQQKIYKNSLCFSVIRNPYDVLVSYYTFGWPYKKYNSSKKVRKVYKEKFKTFDDFAKAYCDPNFKWKHSDNKKFLFFPLFDLAGICRTPYVLRLDMIDSALKVFANRLDFETQRTGRTKSSKPPEKQDYRVWYSDKTREIVEEKLKRELDTFGYDFNGPTDKRCIIDTSNIRYTSKKDKLEILRYSPFDIFDILNLNRSDSMKIDIPTSLK